MACELPILVVSGMAFEARLARGEGIHTFYGLDSGKLTQNIEQAIKNGVSGIISFGTAAGLSPTLSAGDIVIAREVRTKQQAFSANTTWADELAKQLPDAISASIAGVDSALTSPEAKAALHKETGAMAADMESHRAAQLAVCHNLPFAMLRVVLDDAYTSLPSAALAAATPEGNVNYLRLLSALFANLSQIGDLIHLARASARAKKSLLRCGDLIKDNRFGLMHLG